MIASLAELEPLTELPGAEVVLQGLRDVTALAPTPEAALVQAATERFAQHGVRIPRLPEDAELVLYRRLGERMGPGADVYGRYNAWLDDLVSFLCALDRRRALRGKLPSDARS
ncbi:MAG: hypothetical protein H6725_19205 [Sandaracinaceae bacterium]|nr:hypothetical protein [Sandaracinaceae bacterium]